MDSFENEKNEKQKGKQEKSPDLFLYMSLFQYHCHFIACLLLDFYGEYDEVHVVPFDFMTLRRSLTLLSST